MTGISLRREKCRFLWVRVMVWTFMAFVAVSSFSQLRKLPYVKTKVSNIMNRTEFEKPTLPGFIQQDPNAKKLVEFRQQHTASLISAEADEVAKVVAIQHWVRSQESDYQFYQAQGPLVDGTEDPEQYLQMQRRGIRSACRRFSYILVGSLLSVGIQARLVTVAPILDRDQGLPHALVEVRLQKQGRWVLVDPTYDAFVLVDGQPASVIEVHDAAQVGSHRLISWDQHGFRHRLPPVEEYRSSFRHIYVSKTNAIFDGYRYGVFVRHRIEFVHYVAPGIEPYPENKKELLLIALGTSTGIMALVSVQILLGFVRLFDLQQCWPAWHFEKKFISFPLDGIGKRR
jgi:hypothetical protein